MPPKPNPNQQKPNPNQQKPNPNQQKPNPNQQKPNPNQQKPNPNQQKPNQNNTNNNNNNNNNNNTNKNKNNNNNNNNEGTTQKPQKEKKPTPPAAPPKPTKTQSEVPPVVMSVSTRSEVRFMPLPIDPEQFPQTPQYLPNISIPFPTSDLIWTDGGDRCAVCTSEGIMVYNINIAPGASFELQLHANLPNKTSRYLQFSPLGNFLLSYETNTRSTPVNLLVWDMQQWSNGVASKAPAAAEANPEEDGEEAKTPTPALHPSVVYSMTEKRDVPRLSHSTVQWTDDEEYCFVLQPNAELLIFAANNMSKPKKNFQQKGLSCFQLSKLPRNNDKLQQFVSLFSPSLREQPGKCLLYRVVDLVEGQSVVGSFTPLPIDIQMGKYPAGTEVAYKFGPLKPLQSLVVFRCTEVQMLWHHQSQALLVRSSFDDGSANSYYAETRLYVMYTDREPVAVHFGDASTKGDIHDVQWCPTGFEFCTLHGPAREASCILWYAKDCTAVRSIGAGAWNTIRYSPSGRLLLLAGFGSLAGRVDVWEKQKLVRLYRGMDSDSPQTIMWSPCGRYYLSGTIFPHLRVGNQLKVNRFDGKLLHKEVAKEPAIQKDIKSEKSEGFLGGVAVPSEGHFTQVSCNFYPRLNYFDDLKLAPEILDGAQKVMQVEAAKQPQALPPGVSKFSSAASRSKYSSNFEEQQQQQQQQINQPRDFIKERKQNGGTNNHSGDAVFSTKVTAQQQQQQQQQQPKPQSNNNNNNNDFGSWRR